MEYLFLLGRVLYGGFFLMSGLNHFTQSAAMTGYAQSKGVPAPKLAVLGTGLLLLLGGASVLLGVAPRVGVLLLVVFLVPTTFVMHAYWKVQDAQWRQVDQINFMKNLALLGAALSLLFVPEPWPLSLG
jgi:putative oxidoreductase